ncbi:hypothetical protein EDB83DRAFT_2325243 [Lactarius deliciosus]|nr:hypothetical protein EDB83DRAFT_2325243 [Lactarius deliciosus]
MAKHTAKQGKKLSADDDTQEPHGERGSWVLWDDTCTEWLIDWLEDNPEDHQKLFSVTVLPQTNPQTPYLKTLNTVRRRTPEDDAKEEAAIARLVAEHTQYRAKSPTPYYQPRSAQKLQEYWE